MSRYTYRPLEPREIRLLEINDTGSYCIEHVSLDTRVEYETVSYVWGDPAKSDFVELADGSTIPINRSLAKALPYLIQACRSRYLWIDQITIDQSNIAERSAQVRIMGEIYSRSSRCLIWIDYDSSPDAEGIVDSDWNQGVGREILDFFQRLGDEQHELYASPVAEEASPKLWSINQNPLIRQTTRVKDNLQWFFEHPWFTRTWVYQEFVLAPCPIFLIGTFELPGIELYRAFERGRFQNSAWYDNFLHRLQVRKSLASVLLNAPGFEFLFAAVRIRDLRRSGRDATADSHSAALQNATGFNAYEVLTFADTLEKMGGSKSQDDRDHAYAFLGLAPFLLDHMRVDYSLTVEEIFTAMTKALIRVSGCLDLITLHRFAANLSKSRLRLPTWVPDWTCYTHNVHILCHDNLFDACGKGFALPWTGKCKHVDPPTSPWDMLQVAGKMIDVVTLVLPPFSAYQVTSSLDIDCETYPGCLPWEMLTINRFMAEIFERGVPQSQHFCRKSLLRTLFMDGVQWAAIASLESGRPLYRAGPTVIGEPHHKKMADVISVLTECKHPDFDCLPHGATRKVLHELSEVQYRRRVVCCASGRLAFATDLVEKGDEIAILHGSRTPVALRAGPDRRYGMMGQCYYDGAMYGEMADPEDDNALKFTLA